jgi:hypothetical protein
VQDASQFRSLAGALQYLTFTRHDVSYVVQQVYMHMHDPREPHLEALKHILHDLQGILELGLLHGSSTIELTVYTNANWVGCPDSHLGGICLLTVLSL